MIFHPFKNCGFEELWIFGKIPLVIFVTESLLVALLYQDFRFARST